MTKIENKQGGRLKSILLLAASVVVAMLAGAGIDLAVRPTKDGDVVVEASYSIELSESQVPAEIETEDGAVEVIEAPTVEAVDGNQLVEECPEGEEECGLGLFIYAPTETPTAFKDYVIGHCYNTDGAYGAQCWDLADMYWQNYAGRRFSTCGTGAAKGSWNCKEYNAGDEFALITDPTQLQAGDWVIFGSGMYGHVGMALGGYNNGYVALLGQNQGGSACEQGGSAANIINISTKSFVGAYRPKSYIKEEPKVDPIIPITGCIEWHVMRGDTMGKIMYECEGFLEYGAVMDYYASTWYSRIVRPGQSVYDGWRSESGVGLYENDWIDHDIGGAK